MHDELCDGCICEPDDYGHMPYCDCMCDFISTVRNSTLDKVNGLIVDYIVDTHPKHDRNVGCPRCDIEAVLRVVMNRIDTLRKEKQ